VRVVAVALAGALLAAGGPRTLARVPTGAGPCGAAAGFGSVWVAVYGTGKLVRIDPARNRVTRTIAVARGICPVTVAAGAVWVASDRTDVLYRVDPRRGGVTARIPVARWPAHLAAGLGSLWVSGYERGVVTRIDPRTNAVQRVYEVGGNPSGLAIARGSLFLSFARAGTSLGRLDTATGTVRQLPIGHAAPGFLTAAFGSLWTTTEDGFAVRVDPASGAVLAALPVPGTPAGMATGPDGRIWVAEKQNNTLTRIEPATNRVVDVTGAGPGAIDVVRAAGGMWVTSYAGADVWRFR
jgi:streptogramin lyase